MSVNWTALEQHKSGAITFEPSPYNSFGLSVTEIILFNDVNDTGSIENIPMKDQLSFPADSFNWQYNVSVGTVKNISQITVTFFASTFANGETFSEKGGEVAIIVKNSAQNIRGVDFPRLQVKPSASNFDIVLDHFTPNFMVISGPLSKKSDSVPAIGNFTHPRYAIKLVLFSSEEPEDGSEFHHVQDRSQDDEYSPGVFMLDDINTPRARSYSEVPEGGYIEWRPVVYYSYERDVTKSTLPSLSAPPNDNETTPVISSKKDTLFVPDFILQAPTSYDNDLAPVEDIGHSLKKSLAYALFGEDLTEMLSAQTLVSIGAKGDGFYTTYDYCVWTFTAGSGYAAQEKLSVGVLIALLCGVALPVLTLFIAGFVVKAYQCKKGRENNQRSTANLLENEELNEET